MSLVTLRAYSCHSVHNVIKMDPRYELRAGLSGDRIPVGGEIFCTCPDQPWGQHSLQYNGYRVFPGAKVRPGREADPSPPSSAVVMKGYSYTSTPPMGRIACTEIQCLYKGAFYRYELHTQVKNDNYKLAKNTEIINKATKSGILSTAS